MKPSKDLLERVTARVLEEAAFVFARPLTGDPPTAEGWAATGARLRFAGPFSGYLEIWAPNRVARLLAANMLGQEEDGPDVATACVDAVMETLNIICGNLLTEMAGQDPIFSLGTPNPREQLTPFDVCGEGVEAWLTADGHPLLLRMLIAGQKPQVA